MSTTDMKSHLKSKLKKDIDKYNEPKGKLNLTCMFYSSLSTLMFFSNFIYSIHQLESPKVLKILCKIK